MLEDLEEMDDELSSWERGLVGNCMSVAQKDNGSTRRLTEGQVEHIERVWKEKNGQA
jgi:hypothetical protein